MAPVRRTSSLVSPADTPAADWFRLGDEGAPLAVRAPELPSADPDSGPAEWPVVPDYEILGFLGRGGMGVVFQARHRSLGRVVALKMFRADPLGDASGRARFRAEAETLAGLRHANIVQVYDIGVHNGLPYFTLEYVEGGSLRDRLRAGAQPPAEAARLLETLARAAHAAHQAGIIHRDLKPGNILLTKDGIPKITDFGLAKRLEGDPNLTRSGVVVGTPTYMAPEQLTGQSPVGPAADIYALGVILYELLTGRPPFEAASPSDLLFQVSLRDPIAPGYWLPQLPRGLEMICLRCLAKDPRDRYPSALALADDLRAFLDGKRPPHRGAGPLRRAVRWCRRYPLASGAAVLAGALVAAALFTLVAGRNQAERERDEALIERDEALVERDQARQEGEQVERDRQAAKADEAAARAGRQGALADLTQERKRGQQARAVLDTMSALTVEELLPRQPELKEEQRQLLARAAQLYEEYVAGGGSDVESRTATAAAYFRLANVRQRLGDGPEAEAAYRKGAAILEKLLADQPEERQHRHNLATTYNRLGILLRERGRNPEAEPIFRLALKHQLQVVAGPNASPDARRDLAGIHVNLGLLYASQGRLPEAESEFANALPIRKELANRFPRDQRFRQDLAATHAHLAGVLRGRGDDAIREYRQAAEVYSQLTRDFPHVPEFRHERAALHNILGVMFVERRRWGDAEAEHRQALTLREQLASEFPASRNYALDLGGSYCNFGHLLLDSGKHEETLEWYHNALRVLRPLHAKDGKFDTARHFLRNTYLGRARAHDALERHAKAAPDWEQVVLLSPEREGPMYRVNLADALARNNDHDRVFAIVGDQLADRHATADPLYQLARACGRAAGRLPEGQPARDQYAQHGVALLARAQTAGLFADPAQAEKLLMDEGLAPFRSRDEFQKLLGEAKAKTASGGPRGMP